MPRRYVRGRGNYSVGKVIKSGIRESLKNNKILNDARHLVSSGLIDDKHMGKIVRMAQMGKPPRPIYMSPAPASWIEGAGAYNLNGLASAASAFNPLLGMAIKGGQSLFNKRSSAHHTGGDDWGIAGQGAYHRRRRWRGRGAYIGDNMSGNNLMGGHVTKDYASLGDETNGIVITHKEYLRDLTPTGSNFQTLYSAFLNPGLAASFPWLSQIAQYFEEYEFIQLIYQTESMITEGNTNAAGTIIAVTQYNPTNPLFTSKDAMQQYEHSQSYKVTQHAVHGVECDPNKMSGNSAKYIRTSTTPTQQDQKTYDLGLFQIASQNCFANLNLGELWVSYKVVLKKAKIPPLGSQPSLPINQAFWVSGTGIASPTPTGDWLGTGINTQVPFQYNAANAVSVGTNAYDYCNPNGVMGNVGFELSRNVGKYTITFPTSVEQGIYLVIVHCTMTTDIAISANCFDDVGTGNSANIEILGSQNDAGTLVSRTCAVCKIRVNAPGPLLAKLSFNNQTASAGGYTVRASQGTFIKVIQCNNEDSRTTV